MNERILELAHQEGLDTQHNGIVLIRNVNAAQAFEKFAQSIVEQCAQQVDWILAEGGGTQGDVIRKHFGAES